MKDKKPYDLKTFVRFYNLYQIVGNAYTVYKFTEGWTAIGFPLGCTLIDRSNDPVPYMVSTNKKEKKIENDRMLSYIYYFVHLVNYVSVCQGLSHSILYKNVRLGGDFCNGAEKKTKPGVIFACVSSHHSCTDYMGRNKVLPWRDDNYSNYT